MHSMSPRDRAAIQCFDVYEMAWTLGLTDYLLGEECTTPTKILHLAGDGVQQHPVLCSAVSLSRLQSIELHRQAGKIPIVERRVPDVGASWLAEYALISDYLAANIDSA